jgi:hypothetical protein
VINAPRDAEQGLARLNANDAVVWKQAVTFYSEGLSRKDAVFDEPLPAIAHALADADDAPSLRGAAIDSTIAATLERVAPIFRKAWWPTQRAGNEAWLASVQPLIDRYVAVILRDQARAAGVRVPPGLSHGMVFMTAGEAVRSVMPDHVPYADKFGVWNRGLASLHDALTTYWLPYLRGQSTLANALAGLMGKR